MRGEEDRVNARNQENLVRYTCSFGNVFVFLHTHRQRHIRSFLTCMFHSKTMCLCSARMCGPAWNVGGKFGHIFPFVTDSRV